MSPFHHYTRLVGNLLFASAAGTVLASTGLAQPAGVSEFTVEIPQAAGNFGINHAAGVITFTDDPSSATVRITNEHGVECTLTDSTGGDPDVAIFDPAQADCTGGSSQPINDTAIFTAPESGFPAGDPQAFRYRFDLFPNSNIDFSTPGACPDNSGGTDTWTIAIEGAPLAASSVCLVSFARSVPGLECQSAEQEINSTNPAEVASVLINGTPATQLCGSLRPATDVMLVLDRSGSMSSSTLGSSSRPKFAALRDAVSDFAGEWTALRALEGSPPPDNIGLVFFDTDAANPVTVPLAPFTTASGNVVSEAQAECNGPGSTSCSGSTSIGDGLEAAVAQLFGASNGNRKAIVLMSDGMQNTATRVTVDDTNDPTEVLLYESNPASTSPLFGPSEDAVIYSVTVGTSTAVSADLNEDLARATGGFYVNTEDDQEFVRPFFLELLDNALRFNSWQTLRLASGEVTTEAPLEIGFPVSTTTRAMTVNLLWDAGRGNLNATLLPPGYPESDAISGTAAPGALRFSISLPLDPPVTPEGDWVLRIRPAGVDGDARAELRRPIPFNVTVTGDDRGLHASLDVASANYTPGDEILITARVNNPETLTEFGANATLVARILRPGEPIGDILAGSSATGTPSGDDPGTAADAKLQSILAETPDALKLATNSVTLVDDGTGGDATAGDGVFSGTIEAQEPGHYTALITVEGMSERSSRFSREAKRSVHVRSVPDEITTQEPVVTAVDGGTQVVLTFTPKTAFGHAMVGFAPYFPVTSASHPTVIPVDNLDGSYTATLVFPDDPPGDIAINWIESSADLSGVVAEDLPVGDLGGQVIVSGIDIEPPPDHRIWWYILAGLIILLLLIFLIRRLLRP